MFSSPGVGAFYIMKRIIVLVIYLIPSVILSQELFKPWSCQDKILQGVYLVITSMDWIQTKKIVQQSKRDRENPALNKKVHKEGNPFLGEEPSQSKVDNFILLGMILHTTFTWMLPSNFRPFFQGLFIIIETDAVIHNNQRGFPVLVINYRF